MKLIEILERQYPETSKSRLKKWVVQGRVYLNGALCKAPHQEVSDSDRISLEDKKEFAREEIQVLYKDDSVIVVAKPAGLLTVAHDTKQLPNCHSVLKKLVAPLRVWPVHRLDRDTSGILVFALTETARDHLKQQFFAHSIHRQYRAILEGEISPLKDEWRSYLYEDKSLFVHSSQKQSDDSKLAITHYEVIHQNSHYSEVVFRLKTGRKNQIRAQSLENGHPIVGDKKYGAKTNRLKRLALHAEELAFIHPKTDKLKTFRLPADKSFALLAH